MPTVESYLEQAQKALDDCQPDLARLILERALEQSAGSQPDARVLEALGVVQMELAASYSAVDSDRSRADCSAATSSAESYFRRAIEADVGANVVGSAAYMYLGQLTEAEESVSFYERGLVIIEREMLGMELNGEEFAAAARKASTALCSMAEIFMTDCW
ncbi:hypothetical protein HK101_006351 [Irineochytrium annulatum]|nr:hypothetical protein HK101_006351 [Irineochytrium annulatum]